MLVELYESWEFSKCPDNAGSDGDGLSTWADWQCGCGSKILAGVGSGYGDGGGQFGSSAGGGFSFWIRSAMPPDLLIGLASADLLVGVTDA